MKATGHVDPSQPLKVAQDNAQAMGLFDWATYSVASYVVALTLVGELKDIMLVARAVSLQSMFSCSTLFRYSCCSKDD